LKIRKNGCCFRERAILAILKKGENIMLSWAITFLVIALIAGVVGLTGVAGTATHIAWVLFVVFLIIFVISFITGKKPIA
jgi:uncharacterized membrane protein YtjA (UPF0391 family)